MNITRVKVSELLKKLEENREKHEAEFVEAKAAWRKKVIKRYVKMLKAMEEKEDFSLAQSPLHDLPKPQHYLGEYDVAIERMNWEQEDVVELDDQQFQAWVLDQWNWSRGFQAATSMYNG